jgi:hypothetical protein
MFRNHMHRSSAQFVATSLALGALAVTASGEVSAQAAEQYGYTTRLTFDKNQSSPSNSRLHWQVYRVYESGRTVKIVDSSWRAGSGLGNRDGKNECKSNRGWLPNGEYDVTLYWRYSGNFIKGVAFRLNDKRCNPQLVRKEDRPNRAVLRTDLFIHSEMTSTGHQGTAESQRWTNSNPNDYLSAGCIKLNPPDIKAFANSWQRYHRPGSTARFKLRVVS